MSTTDISRFLLQPRKHYSGARMQQGRVILDSDFNEEGMLDDEEQRHELLDLIGGHGSPDNGFSVGSEPDGSQPLRGGDPATSCPTVSILFDSDSSPTPDIRNYWLRAGTMYVGGMRFVLDEPEQIAFQRDFLQAKGDDMPKDTSEAADTNFLILEAWEQCVTAVEDPEILENALGGPDTSTRVRRMRRVKNFSAVDASDDCGSAWTKVRGAAELDNATIDVKSGEVLSHGRMWIDFATGPGDECAPCDPALGGRYLGSENQAFRIMLTSPTRFVWANDNAAPIYKIVIADSGPGTATIKMLTQPRDVEHFPRGNRVIEIVPWSALLDNGAEVAEEIGVFARVTEGYDPATQELTVAVDSAALDGLVHHWNSPHPDAAHLNQDSDLGGPVYYMRVWHMTDNTDVDIPTTSTDPLGDTGLIPVFTAPGRRGDFWIAAARPDTPDRLVPNDLHLNTAGVPPHGPRHFLAPLALINWAIGGSVDSVHDCRRRIHPVVDECCTIRVGDGAETLGDVQSIAEALALLPSDGGKICLLAGTHLVTDEVVISIDNVQIEGCGLNTRVKKVIPDSGERGRIFFIDGGSNVLIENITFEAFGTAIGMNEVSGVTLRNLRINGDSEDIEPSVDPKARALVDIISEGNTSDVRTLILIEDVLFDAHGQFGVFIEESVLIEIRGCQFNALSRPNAEAKSAIYVFGFAGLLNIRENNVFMQSTDLPSTYPAMVLTVEFGDIASNRILCDFSVYGGIQIFAAEVLVSIRDNEISGGYGHGITLGGVVWFRESDHTEVTDSSVPIATTGVGFQQTQCPPGPTTGTPGLTGHPRKITIDGETFIPAIKATLDFIEIRDNSFFEVGTNGISALAILPPEDAVEAGIDGFQWEAIRLDIIDNSISDVGVGPLEEVDFVADALPFLNVFGALASPSSPHVPGLGLSRMPYAAIMIPAISASDIVGNRIADVGGDNHAPFNGIYILFADTINIAGNTILGIGQPAPRNPDPVGPTSPDALKPGNRAGIFIGFAGGIGAQSGDILQQIQELRTFPVETPTSFVPAHVVQIRDNTVVQIEGRALDVRATGAVQVIGNSLVSRGNHGAQRSEDWYLVGDIVFILDLGRPWEACIKPAILSPFENTTLNLTTTLITEYLTLAEASPSPSQLFAFVGTGGHVNFSNNDVQYLWDLQQVPQQVVPLSFSNLFIHSLDHVTALGNQIVSRISDEQSLVERHRRWLLAVLAPNLFGGAEVHFGALYSSLQVSGFTVNVSENRISHCVEDAIFSGNVVGFAENVTGFNQSTTCIPAFVLDPQNQDGALFAYNQPLFQFFTIPGTESPGQVQMNCDTLDRELSSGIEGVSLPASVPSLGAVLFLVFSLNLIKITGWQVPDVLSPPP